MIDTSKLTDGELIKRANGPDAEDVRAELLLRAARSRYTKPIQWVGTPSSPIQKSAAGDVSFVDAIKVALAYTKEPWLKPAPVQKSASGEITHVAALAALLPIAYGCGCHSWE